MSYGDVIVSALQVPSSDLEKRGDSLRLVWVLFVIIGSMFFLGFYAFALFQLRTAWQTGQWDTFWTTALGIVQFFPVIRVLIAYWLWRDRRRVRAGAVILRHAILASNDTLAPAAQDQPAPLTGLDFPTGVVSITPLRRAPGARSGKSIVVGSVLIVVGLLIAILGGLTALVLITTAPTDQPLGPNGIAETLATAVVGVLIVIPGIVIAVRHHHAIRTITVTADDFGIEWTPSGDKPSPLSTPWTALRAFYTFTYPQASVFSKHQVYGIESDGTVFAWIVRNTANEAERRAAERLNRVIMTRTHLTMRDITLASSKLAAAPQKTLEEWQKIAMVELGTSSPLGLPEYATPFQRPKARFAPGCAAAVTVVLLLALLYGGGWGLGAATLSAALLRGPSCTNPCSTAFVPRRAGL